MSGRNHESTSTVHSRPRPSCSSTWSTTGRQTLSSDTFSPNSVRRSSGGNLKNAHWSPSKSALRVKAAAATGSNPRAFSTSIQTST